MKFKLSTGLLAAVTDAATVDGHSGAYVMIDWVAQLDELATTSTVSTIGLKPSVQKVITTFDGGKVMGGYGYYDNLMTFGWVVKMWGSNAN